MTATASPIFSCPTTVRRAAWRLYHNLGNGKFEDVTKKAGLDPPFTRSAAPPATTTTTAATDLAVSLNGRVLLLHNEKNGTFKDVTDAAGIKSAGFNLGLTFIDYDHDGDLDLYVTRYNDASQYDPRLRNAFTAGVQPEGSATCGATTATEPSPMLPSDRSCGDLAGRERGWYRLQQ